ncbi:hypothetical protein HPP92_019928 [Vanilla planifolia]|uniref:Vicilin N-terminal domain-containing protein n=1 Tax=Vanilla planifolia TaxID=51239 RepID=A0A835Q9X7_VANPL|nr:hypothetical protein HPP92_019928 [Vanilla planifolia]
MASRLCLCILFVLFIFPLLLSSTAADDSGSLEQCRRSCMKGDPSQRMQCEQSCEQRFGQGRSTPEEELHRCRLQCKKQEHDPFRMQQCESECEERFKKEKERQGGGKQGTDHVDNKRQGEKLEQCRRECQRMAGGDPQRVKYCEVQCEEKYGGKGGMEDVSFWSREEAEKEFWECVGGCQREGRRGEGKVSE